jgi:hypothetical protein
MIEQKYVDPADLNLALVQLCFGQCDTLCVMDRVRKLQNRLPTHADALPSAQRPLQGPARVSWHPL